MGLGLGLREVLMMMIMGGAAVLVALGIRRLVRRLGGGERVRELEAAKRDLERRLEALERR